MLALPTKGFGRSVNVHNVKLHILCDWIESSLLFVDQQISKSDIADVLIEEHVYDERDMALERLTDAWAELRTRASLVGRSAPYSVETRRLVRTKMWRTVPAHSFCLLLSYSIWNRNWSHTFGYDHATQGELFEEMTKEAMNLVFGGWEAHVTGWSRTHIQKLSAVVEEVANHLGEPLGHVGRWNRQNGKDAGLDVLLYYPFDDQKRGLPVYMIQCATGENFEEKLNTPDINLWTRLVDFSALPKRAFSTPLSLPAEDFHQYCVRVDGPIFDRYRLLSAGEKKTAWLSTGLRRRIVQWLLQRVQALDTI